MIVGCNLILLSLIDCCSWMPSDYVDPCTPPSPSISLVHAYRDQELVSVPCNLLVQGDVVVLGPGHSAPAQVQQVDKIDSSLIVIITVVGAWNKASKLLSISCM